MPNYDPQTWVNYDPATPLSAERLGHIEQGVDAANEAADAALAAASAPSWESIGGKPETFPAETHKHGVNDLNPGDLKMSSYGFSQGAAQLTSDGSAVTVNGNLYTTGFGYFEKSARFKGSANIVTVEGALDVVGDLVGKLIHGTGFPEGKVSAPVGAFYVDRSVTSGALVWVKQSGTDNTGWVVLQGDTGWRLLPLENGWSASGTNTATHPAIRRVGNTVSLRLRNLRATGATSTTVSTVPVEFRPPSADGGLHGFGGSTIRTVSVDSAGVVQVLGYAATDAGMSMSVTWQTARPWGATPFSSPA